MVPYKILFENKNGKVVRHPDGSIYVRFSDNTFHHLAEDWQVGDDREVQFVNQGKVLLKQPLGDLFRTVGSVEIWKQTYGYTVRKGDQMVEIRDLERANRLAIAWNMEK